MKDARSQGAAGAKANTIEPPDTNRVSLRAQAESALTPDEPLLCRELLDATARLTSSHREKLAELGIGEREIALAGHVGAARIQPTGRLYVPAPHGLPALVIGCWWSPPPSALRLVENPVLGDLVCFQPARPDRWWYRTGDGDTLGWSNLLAAIATGQPLRLHATPLQWLQAGATGVCPLALLEQPADAWRAAS